MRPLYDQTKISLIKTWRSLSILIGFKMRLSDATDQVMASSQGRPMRIALLRICLLVRAQCLITSQSVTIITQSITKILMYSVLKDGKTNVMETIPMLWQALVADPETALESLWPYCSQKSFWWNWWRGIRASVSPIQTSASWINSCMSPRHSILYS